MFYDIVFRVKDLVFFLSDYNDYGKLTFHKNDRRTHTINTL